VVVVNQEQNKTITANVHITDLGCLVAASPEQSEAHPTSGTLTIPPNDDRATHFRALERRARAARVGLWGACLGGG